MRKIEINVDDFNLFFLEAIEFLNAHVIPMKNGEMSFEEYVKFAKETRYYGIDMMSYHL